VGKFIITEEEKNRIRGLYEQTEPKPQSNELTDDELKKINDEVDREVKQIEDSKKDLQEKIEFLETVLQKLPTIKKPDGLDDDWINDLIKDKEEEKKRYETYLKNWKNVDRDEIFNRISTHYLNNKRYEEEKIKNRESKTFGNQDVIDLFVTSLEGGSNYWYLIKNLPKEVKYDVKENDAALSEAIGKHILEGGYIQFYDVEDEDELLGDVDMDSILDAITLMKKDFPEVWNRILDEEYDAGDADIFLQLCVMGDVVFG